MKDTATDDPTLVCSENLLETIMFDLADTRQKLTKTDQTIRAAQLVIAELQRREKAK